VRNKIWNTRGIVIFEPRRGRPLPEQIGECSKVAKEEEQAAGALEHKPAAHRRRIWIAGGIVAALLVGAVACVKIITTLSSPDLVLLLPKNGAQWIRFHDFQDTKQGGVSLRPEQEKTTYATAFRKKFAIDRVPEKAVLCLTILKKGEVLLDGTPVYQAESASTLGREASPDRPERSWKEPIKIDLAPYLTPGAHELTFVTINPIGPNCVRAYCDALGLYTGEDWESTRDGKTWFPAFSVDHPVHTAVTYRFERADKAFLGKLPFLIPVFLFVFGWSFWGTRRATVRPYVARYTPGIETFRWLLILAWVLMASNNLGKIPEWIGFDIPGHVEYIKYVAANWRIPLASEGWVMFQAPLFYMLSAPLNWIFGSPEMYLRALKILPLLCGMAQIEISYRTVRYVWPDRKDLQAVGMVLGGFMPMNIYMSQYVGNELLAGATVALVVMLAVRYLRAPKNGRTWRAKVLLGAILGVALLSKATTTIILLPLAVLILYASIATGPLEQRRLSKAAAALAVVFAVAFLVAGWWYVRNQIHLGKPFLGGWEPERDFRWWQYPGYRSPGQFYRFGQALFYPVYASVIGFWDALHSSLWMDGYIGSVVDYERRPCWNYGFALSGVWLAFIPLATMLAGVIAVARHPHRAAHNGTLFAILCLAVYLATMFYAFLTVPVYCVVKGTYTLGLLPCYAILTAAGFEWIARWRLTRSIFYGAFTCWAISAYLAYFII